MNLMVLLIIGIVLMLVLLYPSSKILTILVMTIFVLMIAGTRDSYDYIQYLIMYSRATNSFANVVSGTWLLTKIMRLGSLVGLSYESFRLVITIVESIVIQFSFKKYSKNTAFAWLLFLLFPGWWLTTLFRHTIALTIMIWAVRYLVENQKYNTAKYIVCVVAAGTFHSAFWFFLFLVVIKFFNEKQIIIISVVLAGVLFTAKHVSFINNLLIILHIEDDIAERIQARTTTFWGILLTIASMSPVLLSGLLGYWINIGKVKFGKRENVENSINEISICNSFYKICCTYTFLIGISLVSSLSSRLSQFYSFIFIAVCTNSIDKYRMNTKGKIFVELGCVLGALLLTYIVCSESISLYERIIKAIFDTNIFLNF